jgi:putative transposase
VEVASTLPAADLKPSLGLDLGVTLFAAGSDGQTLAPLKALSRHATRLRRYQRAVSRKQKGSANRKKAVRRLCRLHQRLARQRQHWLHQQSTRLAQAHAVVVVEDLQVRAMTASARGTKDQPGRQVRAKAALNRSILDAAWAEFRRQLSYKLAWRGGELLAVPAAYTSQRCSVCGHVHADNRKTQAVFACVACGHTEHADVNAAKNILAAGHAVWTQRKPESAACGGDVRHAKPARARRAAPTKQEPTEETCHA